MTSEKKLSCRLILRGKSLRGIISCTEKNILVKPYGEKIVHSFSLTELDPYFSKGNELNPLSLAFSTKFSTSKHFKRPFRPSSALH